MDADELLKKIREQEPDYTPPNVHSLRPTNIADYPHLTYEELKKAVPPPIEYVLYPCLPTQGIAFIYAATGLGKTLLALNLAYAIAAGGEFLKYSCPKPRKILYIDGEMPFNQLHARFMQISSQQGELDFNDNFSVLTPDNILPYTMPKIDSLEGQAIYDEIFDKFKFDVVFFDNVSVLSSIDESKSNEWIIVQNWLLKQRAKGRTLFLIHHSGKDKNGYRGTSRMLDCVDVAISLQPVTQDGLEEENIKGKKFKIVYQKARMFGGKDALPFEVNLEGSIWSYKSMEQTDMDKVIELVGMKMSQRDIAKEMLLSLSKVNRLVKKARQLGLIRD